MGKIGLRIGKIGLRIGKIGLKTSLRALLHLEFYWPRMGEFEVTQNHLDGCGSPWNDVCDDRKAFLEVKNFFKLV